MNCVNFHQTLKTWTADDWEEIGDSIPPEIQDHARYCSSCRSLLELTLMLINGETLNEETPAYLASRVKAHLPQRQPGVSPRRWLWAGAALATLILALTVVFRFAPPGQTVLVRFSVEINEADQVHVVGDWNGWEPGADPLTDPDGDGIWETEIRLLSDQEYRYQFLIDNEHWQADPRASLNIDDGFGGINSVLHL